MKKLLLAVLILISASFIYAQNWTYYVQSAVVTSGSPSYIDITIGLKAASSGDIEQAGTTTLKGTFSSDMYDFGSSYTPVLQSFTWGSNYSCFLQNEAPANDWKLQILLNFGATGVTVTTGGISVATLRFYIIDPAGTSQFIFDNLQQTLTDDYVTISASYDNSNGDVTLPVELNNFSADYSTSGVNINWVTESEFNNLGFNLYRSQDEDKDYLKINAELVQGAGHSTSQNTYSYTDSRIEQKGTYYYKLEQIDIDGQTSMFGPISVFVDRAIIPETFSLQQNFPNPFNPNTMIRFGLPEPGNVKVIIYNTRGEQIRELVNRSYEAGTFELSWDAIDDYGRRISSGVYFYKLETESFTDIKKMVYTR